MDGMVPYIVLALIGAVPSSLAAYSAILAARRVKGVHDEVRTNHGMRAGEYAELSTLGITFLRDDVEKLRGTLAEHTEADERNFAALSSQIEESKS